MLHLYLYYFKRSFLCTFLHAVTVGGSRPGVRYSVMLQASGWSVPFCFGWIPFRGWIGGYGTFVLGGVDPITTFKNKKGPFLTKRA